jgi:Winged helix DNA-binding domain
MTAIDIAYQRLCNQHIHQPAFEQVHDIVQWLGAVQAQDYGAAKWALGLRLQNVTENDIEQAFNDGEILRTHVMRPTWHFVSPADIRWLLALTAPRVHAASAYYYRKVELDEATCTKSNAILTKALQGGKHLTRSELSSELQQAGIAASDLLRLSYIIFHAELDGIICSGPRRGKQFTYALLDERVPQSNPFTREEALAELASRYFTSHGPATLQDFVWWSGLSVADARIGHEMVASQLLHETIAAQTYWFFPSIAAPKDLSQTAYLLPNFDEYIVGYTDRSAIFDPSHIDKLDSRNNVLFNHTIVLNGQIVGTWKRNIKKDHILLTLDLFIPLDSIEATILTAANCYGKFFNLPIKLAFAGN